MTTEQMDNEASYFARCLLMPKKFVLADIEAAGGVDLCEDGQVKALAKKYRVSISLMALRIYEVTAGGGAKAVGEQAELFGGLND